MATAAEQAVEENYRIKWVDCAGRKMAILLQNRNGPCPLLAIANTLLVRGNIELHTDMSYATEELLIDKITEYIFRANPQLREGPDEVVTNEQQNLADVILTLPKLKRGIDVNVTFSSPEGLEFTAELACFDMCRIRLVHGWLVDPDDSFSFDSFAKLSYNQLVDLIITSNDISDDLAFADDGKRRRMLTAQQADQFLNDHPSQLTPYGLSTLHEYIRENEVCVFFRNNHFSTLTRRGAHLYLLVSDVGFLSESSIVWERFVGVHGESLFVDARFEASKIGAAQAERRSDAASSGAEADAAAAAATGGAERTSAAQQEESDYQLAKALQEVNFQEAPPPASSAPPVVKNDARASTAPQARPPMRSAGTRPAAGAARSASGGASPRASKVTRAAGGSPTTQTAAMDAPRFGGSSKTYRRSKDKSNWCVLQ